MKAIKDLTNEEKEFISLHYNKDMKAKELAEKLNMSVRSIYTFSKNNNLVKSLNPVFDITEYQEQIIYGGILGDGSFKKNGSNYYYRECHAIPEAGYLNWKHQHLMPISRNKIYYIKKRKDTQNDQVEFCTVNTPSLKKYAEMSIDDVLDNINELGLAIWLLDDGWIRRNSKICSYGLSGGVLTCGQIDKALKKFSSIGLDGHIVGSKKDISFCSDNNKNIKKLMYTYFPQDLDIIKKKIKDLKIKW